MNSVFFSMDIVAMDFDLYGSSIIVFSDVALKECLKGVLVCSKLLSNG